MTKEERDVARMSGLVTYASDKPCIRGHLAARYTSTGNCVPCNVMRNAEKYASNRPMCDARAALWRSRNRERSRELSREIQRRFTIKNPERVRDIRRRSNKAFRLKHPEQIRQGKREWKAKNPDKVAAMCAQRRAAKLKRTPAWADLNEIKCFYYRAQEMLEATGEEYEVDHIVPLQSPFVCGLHVESNLQIVTASFNGKKSNQFNAGYPAA